MEKLERKVMAGKKLTENNLDIRVTTRLLFFRCWIIARAHFGMSCMMGEQHKSGSIICFRPIYKRTERSETYEQARKAEGVCKVMAVGPYWLV